MNIESYYYNCSHEYIDSIDPSLHRQHPFDPCPTPQEADTVGDQLRPVLAAPFRRLELDSIPQGAGKTPPTDISLTVDIVQPKKVNSRRLCRTSTTLKARMACRLCQSFWCTSWFRSRHSSARSRLCSRSFVGSGLPMLRGRLALGIEIVLSEPTNYFAHRKSSIGGMASFDVARETLTTIGLECPIWLVGIAE